ncbi:MAG: hypothetical protein KBS98_07740 [Flavobacterium sp.]|nr:hypothetical protein [Candidatus Neoflavobacterium equi]
MFSTGQLQFAVAFVVVFVIATVIMYRKDLKLHRVYYKGSKWVLVGFFAFIGILFIIKNFLKNF